MQTMPLNLLEELASNLPNASVFNGTCYHKEFIYENHYYEIKFYTVSDSINGTKFWLYNPNHVQIVIRNGSHQVKSI